MTTMLSATSIVGDAVRNNQNEDLGKIEDLMIDTVRGDVQYAVLSFGGFLGIGDKLFAVPMEQLKLDAGNKCFVLNVPKEQLKNAPGFDKDNWPSFADTAFQRQVGDYYSRYGVQA